MISGPCCRGGHAWLPVILTGFRRHAARHMGLVAVPGKLSEFNRVCEENISFSRTHRGTWTAVLSKYLGLGCIASMLTGYRVHWERHSPSLPHGCPTPSFLRPYGLRESFMATLGRLDKCWQVIFTLLQHHSQNHSLSNSRTSFVHFNCYLAFSTETREKTFPWLPQLISECWWRRSFQPIIKSRRISEIEDTVRYSRYWAFLKCFANQLGHLTSTQSRTVATNSLWDSGDPPDIKALCENSSATHCVVAQPRCQWIAVGFQSVNIWRSKCWDVAQRSNDLSHYGSPKKERSWQDPTEWRISQ